VAALLLGLAIRAARHPTAALAERATDKAAETQSQRQALRLVAVVVALAP
jgi:hypothetical protein